MKLTYAIVAIAGGLATLSAQAQTTGYSLSSTSAITLKTCTNPCDCVYHEETGTVTGSFSMAQSSSGIVNTEFAVTGLSFTAKVSGREFTVAGYGSYTVGSTAPFQHRLVLDLTVDGQPQHYDSGLVYIDPARVGSTPPSSLSITVVAHPMDCSENDLAIEARMDPAICYANCDGSAPPPVLNVADLSCFLKRFGEGDPRANCDGGMIPPVLNIADFTCMLQRFAEGCGG